MFKFSLTIFVFFSPQPYRLISFNLGSVANQGSITSPSLNARDIGSMNQGLKFLFL
ncbi:Uncharacterised protein [Yersinia intermedia]|nr:Uncharacterised protein [Yersinia intermedia]